MAKAKFSSRLGLIAATVGSAVGLGNVWRFPAETQVNGGAAFLILYIGCVFLLGIPLMLAEFSLGRGSQSDAVGAFVKLRPHSPWWLTGLLAVVASYLILSFYMVVAGWTFEYLWQSITGNLYDGVAAANSDHASSAIFHSRMEEYVCDDLPPLYNVWILIGLNIAVLLAGVKKGIERLSRWLMPLLFVLLLLFVVVALSLPGSSAGLAFFFNPDFSKITPAVAVSALGQAFFSLSLGMGILITYGAYFPRNTKLVQTSVTVALLDMLVAILMGCIIFPSVASFGLTDAELRGTTLVFVTLPEIFARMPMTQLWSVLFFLLLLVAALTSTISIAEVSISFVEERFRRSRVAATLIVMLPLFLLSSVCSLSFGSLSGVTVGGLNIFDLLDTVATNYMLPIGSLFLCIFIGWIMPRRFFMEELTPEGGRRLPVYSVVIALTRYAAPLLIIAILIWAI